MSVCCICGLCINMICFRGDVRIASLNNYSFDNQNDETSKPNQDSDKSASFSHNKIMDGGLSSRDSGYKINWTYFILGHLFSGNVYAERHKRMANLCNDKLSEEYKAHMNQ